MVVTCSAVDPHYPMNPDPNRYRNKRMYRYKSGNKFDWGFLLNRDPIREVIRVRLYYARIRKIFLGFSDPDPHFSTEVRIRIHSDETRSGPVIPRPDPRKCRLFGSGFAGFLDFGTDPDSFKCSRIWNKS